MSRHRQRNLSESARGERAVKITGYRADEESEAILAELPGTTMSERLDSARRGLFLDRAEPDAEAERPARRHQFVCGCGYVARDEPMRIHQEKYGYRGIHSDRKPFIQRKPTKQ